MFSLSYSAAYDPYNAIFRMLSLLTGAPNGELPLAVLRIADFYLCFPWLLSELRPVREVPGFISRRNALVRSYKKSSFDVLPASTVLFDRMKPIQDMAVNEMVARGAISRDAKDQDIVRIAPTVLSQALGLKIRSFIDRRKDLVTFLTSDLPQVRIFGADGLKHRTGLGEYRYDNV